MSVCHIWHQIDIGIHKTVYVLSIETAQLQIDNEQSMFAVTLICYYVLSHCCGVHKGYDIFADQLGHISLKSTLYMSINII